MTDRMEALKELIARGLTFGDAVNVFAEYRTERELAYVEAAKEKHLSDEGDMEVDEGAFVSESSDGGAYVMAWTWVDDKNEEDEQ